MPRTSWKILLRLQGKYKVILLSDEIYGELNYQGCHQSIARYYPEGTIVASGLSKWAGSRGMATWNFCFSQRIEMVDGSDGCRLPVKHLQQPVPLYNMPAVRAFQGGDLIERYLHNSRKILSALSDWIWNKLTAAGISVAKPDGGFLYAARFLNP